jgi:uncharacterized protein YbcI
LKTTATWREGDRFGDPGLKRKPVAPAASFGRTIGARDGGRGVDGTEDPKASAGERERSLLSRLSSSMGAMQKAAFGKGPVSTKSYMFDDMLLIVMRDGLTQAEQTMLGFGRQDLVREYRQQFENEMTRRIVDMIEELTERKVLTYQSQIMFDPDVVVEMFVFDTSVGAEFAAAGAEESAAE